MRLSEFAGKRIINIYNGGILGTAGDSDLLVNPDTGVIKEIILPPARKLTGNKKQISIPWDAVKKIGSEVIVVDVDESGRYFR